MALAGCQIVTSSQLNSASTVTSHVSKVMYSWTWLEIKISLQLLYSYTAPIGRQYIPIHQAANRHTNNRYPDNVDKDKQVYHLDARTIQYDCPARTYGQTCCECLIGVVQWVRQ